MQVPEVHVLGSRVHLVTASQTVDRMEQWIRTDSRDCHRIVVTGFHGLLEAEKELRLRKILNTADLWTPDGIAPVWLARLRGHAGVQRATGMDIISEFLRRADASGYSSFFYGDTDPTLRALVANLEQRYPRHRIAGSYSPPFRPLSEEEDEEIVRQINDARPDVLWVGLGMPKQDIWIYDHMHRLRVPVAVGVGAAFGFLAGTVRRCPEWIGRMGFEWCYRLAQEPRKLWRRDFIEGPRFLFRLGRDLITSGGTPWGSATTEENRNE